MKTAKQIRNLSESKIATQFVRQVYQFRRALEIRIQASAKNRVGNLVFHSLKPQHIVVGATQKVQP